METEFAVRLVPDAQLLEALRDNEGVWGVAQEVTIDCAEMAEIVNGELRDTIGRKKRLTEWRDKFIGPATQIIENAKALFNPALDALTQSEAHYRKLLTDWTVEQKRIADEAKREAERIATAARQKAEAEAAAIAAKAEQEAAEARRRAQAAEEARKNAERAGDAQTAANAAAIAATANAEAHAIAENAAVEAGATLAAAQAAAIPVQEAAIPSGFGLRQNWVGEIKDELRANTEDDREKMAIQMIACEIARGRVELVAYLNIDWPAVNKSAKAMKNAFSVPGLRAVNKPVSTSRGK